jgi:hypothetical protein
MDGLIDQARRQLWTIVNALADGRRGGLPVRLQVALFEYGNNRLAAERGYVRRVLPFTEDLDRVSEQLFALTTNGGEEYCGTVLQSALDDLGWSPFPADLKVAFIAGNEPFDQGPVDFRKACVRARNKGVLVNTIHCGGEAEGASTGWKDGALLTHGLFATIDQERAVAYVEAPQDAEIARLGVELNRTYVPYGAEGGAGRLLQNAQDLNAVRGRDGSATQRALTKAGRLYSNGRWDLVDAVRNQGLDPAKVGKEELPAEMQGLSPKERRAYLDGRYQEREKIQAEIGRLAAAREKYLASLRPSKADKGDSLDAVMIEALRAQAACRGIELQ